MSRGECSKVYLRALRLPWWVACGACAAAFIGYVVGTAVVYRQAHQPLVEIAKTLPAIPLVGGMMGAFCYFGTARALHPVVAWCSLELERIPVIRLVPLRTKFLTTACVLAVSSLCLLQPAAYTLGQLITERHLTDGALLRLRTVAAQLSSEKRTDSISRLQDAALGAHGYVMMVDSIGSIVTPHPLGYTKLTQERIYQLSQRLQEQSEGEGAWVDRVGRHRIISFVRPAAASWMLISVSFPSDFSPPLHQFIRCSLVVVLEVFFVVVLFGWYYTRGITTPLAELTHAAQRIAEHGDISRQVPVTTDDEISDLARSFNRMLAQLQASRVDVEEYTKRLEQSTQELSALNQEMEDLLRVVSHDLRAPLINIQGFSKRLEPIMTETVHMLDRLVAESGGEQLRSSVATLKSEVQPQWLESLRFISKSVEKMDALLSSLLTVSRAGRKADPLQTVNLYEIVSDVLATFHHQLDASSIRMVRRPLPQGVVCRRHEINQVFSNLISNAINYMGGGKQRVIEIGGIECGESVECFVRDTGVGISFEDHQRIFQMFTRLQTVDAPGEGTGLAYVKRILRSHGGTIWVVSQRGQGSTFFISLPKRQTAARG